MPTATEDLLQFVGELEEVARGRAYFRTPTMTAAYRVRDREPIRQWFSFSIPMDEWVARGKPMHVQLSAQFVPEETP